MSGEEQEPALLDGSSDGAVRKAGGKRSSKRTRRKRPSKKGTKATSPRRFIDDSSDGESDDGTGDASPLPPAAGATTDDDACVAPSSGADSDAVASPPSEDNVAPGKVPAATRSLLSLPTLTIPAAGSDTKSGRAHTERSSRTPRGTRRRRRPAGRRRTGSRSRRPVSRSDSVPVLPDVTASSSDATGSLATSGDAPRVDNASVLVPDAAAHGKHADGDSGDDADDADADVNAVGQEVDDDGDDDDDGGGDDEHREHDDKGKGDVRSERTDDDTTSGEDDTTSGDDDSSTGEDAPASDPPVTPSHGGDDAVVGGDDDGDDDDGAAVSLPGEGPVAEANPSMSRDHVPASKLLGKMKQVFTAADYNYEHILQTERDVLTIAPAPTAGKVCIKKWPKRKQTDASNMPDDVETLERHVQDFYAFFAADWVVSYRKDTKYDRRIAVNGDDDRREVDSLPLPDFALHPDSLSYQQSAAASKIEHSESVVSRQRAFTLSSPMDADGSDSDDDQLNEFLQSDGLRFELLRPSDGVKHRQALPRTIRLPLFALSAPSYDWGRGCEQLFGARTYQRVVDPNTLKVFKEPDKIQFMVETAAPVFALGDFEPWFCSIALYDLMEKKKISEDFHFDHNSRDKKAWLGIDEGEDSRTSAHKAIFSIASPSPDIYLILTVDKVLQGDIDQCRDAYSKATQADKVRKKAIDKIRDAAPRVCKRLGAYKQLFAWSYLKVFDDQGNFQLQDRAQFNPLYPHRPKDNFLDLINTYSEPMVAKKTPKLIPGSCDITVKRLNPREFIPNRLDPSLFPYKDALSADPNPSYARDVQEFRQRPLLMPHTDYFNDLYVYPLTINLSGTDRKVKSVGYKLELKNMDKWDEPGAKMVYGRGSGDILNTSQHGNVVYKSRQPLWKDELKVKLPQRLSPSSHLLFTFYSIAVDEPKKKSKDAKPVQTPIGFAILPLYQESKIVSNNAGDHHEVAVVMGSKLPNFYINKMLKGQLPMFADGKPIFRLRLHLLSTTLPEEDALATFYQYYHLKEFFADPELIDSLKQLQNISPLLAIQALPVLIQALMRVMCTRDGDPGILALKTLLIVMSKIQQELQVLHRPRIGLLHSYIDYAFDNVRGLKKHVYDAVCFNVMSLLMEMGRSTSTPSGLDSGVVTREMLGFLSWWIFDTVSKSLVIDAADRDELDEENRSRRFEPSFTRIVRKMLVLMIIHCTSKAKLDDCQPELMLFHNMAIFIRDFFSLYDRGQCVDIVHAVVTQLDSDASSKPAKLELIMLFKLDFLRIISDHEEWIGLNLPRKVELASATVSQLRTQLQAKHPLVYMLVDTVVLEVQRNAFRSTQKLAISTLYLLLCKHDFDARYGTPEARAAIATMYFPLVLKVVCQRAAFTPWLSAAPKSDDKCVRSRRSKREFFLCVLWVLHHVDRKLLISWLKSSPASVIASFLEVIQSCIRLFEYIPSDKRKVSPFASSAKCYLPGRWGKQFDGKSVMEKALEPAQLRMARAGKMAHEVSMGLLGLVECIIEVWGTDMMHISLSGRMENIPQRNASSPSGADLSGNESSSHHDVTLDDVVFDTLFTWLRHTQSTLFLNHLFDTLYAWVHRFGAHFFASPQCMQLTKQLLQHASLANAEVRAEATAFLYFLLRESRVLSGSMGRMKTVATTAMSGVQVRDGTHLKRALATLGQYALAEFGNPMAGLEAPQDVPVNTTSSSHVPGAVAVTGYAKAVFARDVQGLSVTLTKILADTIAVNLLRSSPSMRSNAEALAELYCRIADGYANAPALRRAHLENLASFQAEAVVPNWPEAAVAMMHVSALIADYLNSHTDMHIQTDTFQRICPHISEFCDVDDPSALASTFTKKAFISSMRLTITFMKHAEMYEYANDLFKVILPIYHADRAFNHLSQCHNQLDQFFTSIAERNEQRLFGTFFRVGFWGQAFDHLNGKEFVYKEPLLTHLYDIKDRLLGHFSEVLGADSVVVMDHSGVVDEASLDPSKAYLQITYLEPYFSNEERQARPTYFQQHVGLSKFCFETPFTKDGRVGQADTAVMYKRKTILTTVHTFPNLLKRSPVRQKEEIILSPIEIAVEAMQNRVNVLKAELNRDPPLTKTLQQVLQGSVLVTVNKGTLEYLDTFLAKASQFPVHHVEALKSKFSAFLRACKEALALNASLIDSSQSEFQHELENGFRELTSRVRPFLSQRSRSVTRTRSFVLGSRSRSRNTLLTDESDASSA